MSTSALDRPASASLPRILRNAGPFLWPWGLAAAAVWFAAAGWTADPRG